MESGPDFGEMMVVVFGDEVEMVHEAHGLLETRVRECVRDAGVVQSIELVCKCGARGSEFRENAG